MSRTRHHGNKAKACYFEGKAWGEKTWMFNELTDPTPPKRKRYTNSWHWMTTPSWWIHEMMEKPLRAKIRKAEQIALVEGDAVFPLAKKPHQYFW